MPGREPGQAHQREPDQEREHSAEGGGEEQRGDVADRVVARGSGRGRAARADFDSSGIVITPATNAPTATKLMCPNESTPELPTKT